MSQWEALFAFLGVSVAIASGFLVGGRILRVKARAGSPLKRRQYECGEEPVGSAWMQFHPRYYLVALFFVLFDVEAVFLFPWSVVVRTLSREGLVAATVFLSVLMLGWVYGIRKAALRWQ